MPLRPFRPPSICWSCRHQLQLTTPVYGNLHQRSYVRHSVAPRPSPDIKHIRRSPGLYSQNCVDRNYPSLAPLPFEIIAHFDRLNAIGKAARPLRERAKALRTTLAKAAYLSGDVAPYGRTKEHVDAVQEAGAQQATLLEEAREVKAQLDEIEREEAALNDGIENMALQLPNLSSTETPVGSEPIVLETHEPDPEDVVPSTIRRTHAEIGAELRLMDFTSAASTSGWGWYFLTNDGALLEQALVQYALEVAMEHGFRIVTPPSLVYSHIASAAGFQPRDQNGETQMYNIQQAEKDRNKPSMVLTGTAEIPFAGMKANTILEDTDLPDKVVGVSRCYRAEAGARGVDTKGLYRVHEFSKVELFGWCLPDENSNHTPVGKKGISSDSTPESAPNSTGRFSTTSSDADNQFAFATTNYSHAGQLFDSILAVQREILSSLCLPYRVLEQPTQDLGASATRKIDMEVIFPSRRRHPTSSATDQSSPKGSEDDGYGEVTSASLCTDYQTRRLATRVRMPMPMGKTTTFPHTVNGTAMAVPRVLAAILEHGWDEKRRAVRIPEVLQNWMGGREWIDGKR
ncbi:seryl-tRNA synthetase [Eremomyces bilateralis CBS 781.70]|uniref:serine--tRNA ligase n=1 Tax=Eremomyces bilateralis CBS 781.70 TaxID=1392243 RepID=A0A6G1G2X3_9PEZI|nr:seryl-tRNA synthetase [Eremomyces bilateralis CBS 781.70]KAF1812266.1 seryl-tRNA synthetase [Eremomyces bilateralis CBS 781.70]